MPNHQTVGLLKEYIHDWALEVIEEVQFLSPFDDIKNIDWETVNTVLKNWKYDDGIHWNTLLRVKAEVRSIAGLTVFDTV